MATPNAQSHLTPKLSPASANSLVTRARNLFGHLIFKHSVLAAAIAIAFLPPNHAQVQVRCEEAFTAAPRASKAVISERVAKNDFITNRDILDYLHDLHPYFKKAL